MRAADIHADEVVEDKIAAGAAADEQSIVVITGDVVAGGQDGAADGIVGALHLDAIAAIGQGGVAVSIEAQEVALDLIAAGAGVNEHAIAGVAGDGVACAGNAAADGVAAAGILNAYLVAHSSGAGVVEADVIAQHLIAAGRAVQQDAIVAVAGDDVAGRRGSAANGISAAGDLDAVTAVGQSSGAVDIEADIVAKYLIAAGAAGQQQAIAAVARKDIAGARSRAADGVVVAENVQTIAAIGQRGIHGIDADGVA